jgi:hypothetical protein
MAKRNGVEEKSNGDISTPSIAIKNACTFLFTSQNRDVVRELEGSHTSATRERKPKRRAWLD